MDIDTPEFDQQRSREWAKLLKKVSRDCKECSGFGVTFQSNQRKAIECSKCYPKARTIFYLKESGMSIEDIQKSDLNENERGLISVKSIFLVGQKSERSRVGFGLLKEEAKKQKKVFYIELPQLLIDLKRGNRNIILYDSVFIDSLDLYRNLDQFIVPFFDGVLFQFKNSSDKKIIVGGETTTDGYANRFVDLYGTNYQSRFV